MSERKNYCPVHHLYYKGSVCPLCEKERIGRMATMYGLTQEEKEVVKEEKVKDREINEDDLAMLVNKFNVK